MPKVNWVGLDCHSVIDGIDIGEINWLLFERDEERIKIGQDALIMPTELKLFESKFGKLTSLKMVEDFLLTGVMKFYKVLAVPTFGKNTHSKDYTTEDAQCQHWFELFPTMAVEGDEIFVSYEWRDSSHRRPLRFLERVLVGRKL